MLRLGPLFRRFCPSIVIDSAIKTANVRKILVVFIVQIDTPRSGKVGCKLPFKNSVSPERLTTNFWIDLITGDPT
jgi:hypothetical protein